MYAQLGPIIFEGAFGFDSYSHKAASTLPQHAVIDGKPRLQKTGDELDTLALTFKLHASFCNPAEKIRQLETFRRDGSVLDLINGIGELLGIYVIQEIGTNVTHTLPDGQIIEASVSVQLIESEAPDEQLQQELDAKREAFASSINTPQQIQPLKIKQSLSGAAMQPFTAMKADSSAVVSGLAKAKNNPAVEDNEITKARTNLTRMRSNLETFEAKLQAVKDYISTGAQLENQVDNIRTGISDTEAALTGGDLDGAIVASQSMQGAVDSANGSASNIAVLSATRKI